MYVVTTISASFCLDIMVINDDVDAVFNAMVNLFLKRKMPMRKQEKPKIQPHWWSKSLAGIFPALTLSYGLVALFAWYGPGGIDDSNKVQVNMWLITPIWLTMFSLVYLFSTGRKAWIWLVSANILVFSLFALLRGL